MLKSLNIPPLPATVHFRPVRAAFFVPTNSSDAFIRAATVATTQWGGLHTLIVPTDDQASPCFHWFFRELLELFEPDLFVDFSDGSDAFRASVERDLRIQFSWRSPLLQAGNAFEVHDHSLHALAAIPDEEMASRALWSPEVSHRSAAANAAVFGQVYSGQASDYANAFSAVRTHKLDSTSPDFWERQIETGWAASPINVTSFHLRPLLVSDGMEAPYFDIILGDSVNSLCLYWGIRAVREITQFMRIGRRTLLCPLSDIEDRNTAQALLTSLRRHLPVLGLTSSVDLMCHTWTDEDHKRAVAALQRLPELTPPANGKLTITHRSGKDVQLEDTSTRPLSYAFVQPDLPGSFRAGADSPIPHPTFWSEGATTAIRYEPIIGLARKGGGNVAVDVESEVLKRYPRSPGVAKLLRNDAWFSRWGLTRLGGIPGTAGYDSLLVPSEWSALGAWFEDRGFQIRMGAAGRYGESAIASLGGIEAVGEIATLQAYRVLVKLALKSSKKVAQYLAKYQQSTTQLEETVLRAFSDLEIGPELKGIPRTLKQLMDDTSLAPRTSIPTTLAILSRLGAIVRGLFVLCPTCGSSEWYALEALDERLLCPGCRHAFHLSLLDDGANERVWQFRLNSLMNRAVDQDLLPNLFTLYRLSSSRPASCRTIGLELLRATPDVAYELDVAFVSDQRLIAAECKASDRLGSKDIDTARAAAAFGCAEFWFATAADCWNSDSLGMIEALKTEISNGNSSMVIGTIEGDQLFGLKRIDRAEPLRPSPSQITTAR
jgi:hypothetical protein